MISRLYLIVAFLTFFTTLTFSQRINIEEETQTLMNRLDTTTLKSIISDKDDIVACAEELLAFYKTRNTVKHPVNENVEEEIISKKDIKYADDALKHVFASEPTFPSYFCGDDINWNTRPVPDK